MSFKPEEDQSAYIEAFYNTTRRHSTIAYRSPAEHDAAATRVAEPAAK